MTTIDRPAGASDASSPRRTCTGPIFVAGADRTGTTLMFALLASHPDLSMARRTNMWRWFDGRYGDLRDPANLDRCLDEIVRYKRMRHLTPDKQRIRRELSSGEPTYARLFALIHTHHAQRTGKQRWGDKSLHTEHHADRVFAAFPDAAIVHMMRDPRDRYASVRGRDARDASRVGPATGRWLLSARAADRNLARYPDRYLVVCYEDLADQPEATMRRVCAFIGAEFAPAMLTLNGAPEHRDSGGNSSFGDLEPGTISTRAIGRFRRALPPEEIAFIQLVAGARMAALGYARSTIALAPAQRARFAAWVLPSHLARMLGWIMLALRRRRRDRVPPRRLAAAQRGRP